MGGELSGAIVRPMSRESERMKRVWASSSHVAMTPIKMAEDVLLLWQADDDKQIQPSLQLSQSVPRCWVLMTRSVMAAPMVLSSESVIISWQGASGVISI